MPESVSGVDEIVERLRKLADVGDEYEANTVFLADAEAAVREARDATVQEIVDALRADARMEAAMDHPDEASAQDVAADFVARRFPNEGTHDDAE